MALDWDNLLITVVDPDSFLVTEDEMIYSLQAEQRMIIFTGERGLDGADGKDGESVHPVGVWATGTEYKKLDLVTKDGTSYVAIQDVPIGVLTSDERYWMISAEKGDQGPEGPQGPAGYGAEWGNIGGTLTDQADLMTAMGYKADTVIIASDFNASVSYAIGEYVIHGGELYRFTSSHSGDWDPADVTAVTVGDELESIQGKADALIIAPAFDSTAAYAIGDYVIYQGTLYRFTAAHSAGAWIGSDVTAVTVGDELEAANDAIAQKAPLASPALTGNPTAPTQSIGDNSTKIATTAFVVSHDPFDITGSISANATSKTFTDNRINSSHWVPDEGETIWGTPSAVTFSPTWTTDPTNHTITLSGGTFGATTVRIRMVYVQ